MERTPRYQANPPTNDATPCRRCDLPRSMHVGAETACPGVSTFDPVPSRSAEELERRVRELALTVRAQRITLEALLNATTEIARSSITSAGEPPLAAVA